MLAPGARVVGPAIIEQNDTTIFVPPDFSAEANAFDDLILSRN